MARSKSEERYLLSRIRAAIGEGKTDYKILEELNITMQTLSSFKQQLFADELETVQSETAAESWVRYQLRLVSAIEDLDDVITDAKNHDNSSALAARVGAIKAKTDLIDRIVDRGRELGVLPVVKAETDSQPHEVESLRALIEEKQRMLLDAARQYGVRDFASLPEPTDDDLYYDLESDEDEDEDEDVVEVH